MDWPLRRPTRGTRSGTREAAEPAACVAKLPSLTCWLSLGLWLTFIRVCIRGGAEGKPGLEVKLTRQAGIMGLSVVAWDAGYGRVVCVEPNAHKFSMFGSLSKWSRQGRFHPLRVKSRRSVWNRGHLAQVYRVVRTIAFLGFSPSHHEQWSVVVAKETRAAVVDRVSSQAIH